MALNGGPSAFMLQAAETVHEPNTRTRLIKRNTTYGLAVILILVCAAALNTWDQSNAPHKTSDDSAEALARAFTNQQSDLQVRGQGHISKILPDDTKGSKHQRLIITTSAEQSILIAHNIDLAPRVKNPKGGDLIEFYGEYEWNRQGGVIHWTHHDPQNRHPHGWLKHEGHVDK